MRKKLPILTAALTVVAGACLGYAVTADDRAEDAASQGTIDTSYSFDVTNMTALMNYADAAVFVTIHEPVKTVLQESATYWRATVRQAPVGSASGEVVVRQLGYVDKDGRKHQMHDQPILRSGQDYLLVVTRDGDHMTLVAGPKSAVPVEPATDQAKLARSYQEAARR